MRKYVVSLVDQALLSAFNFALAIFLLRVWGAETFGIYTFWTATGLLSVGVQNTFVNMPLSVFAAGAKTEEEGRQLGRLLSSANMIFMGVVLILLIPASLTFPSMESSRLAGALGICTYVVGTLFREYVRSVGFAKLSARSVLKTDGAYLVLASTIFILYFVQPESLNLPLVFGCLAGASVVGGLVGLALHHDLRETLNCTSFSFAAYGPIWRKARWSLVGVITTQLQQRGHIYLITAFAGFEATGILAAAGLVFRPVAMALTAWGRMAQPTLARAATDSRRLQFVQTLRVTEILLGVLFAFLCVLLYFSWAPLESFLFKGEYPKIGWLVAGWAAVTFVTGFQSIFSTALVSLQTFRPLAFATVYGSFVSLSCVAALVPLVGYEWSLLGLLMGNLVSFFYILAVFGRTMKKFESFGR